MRRFHHFSIHTSHSISIAYKSRLHRHSGLSVVSPANRRTVEPSNRRTVALTYDLCHLISDLPSSPLRKSVKSADKRRFHHFSIHTSHSISIAYKSRLHRHSGISVVSRPFPTLAFSLQHLAFPPGGALHDRSPSHPRTGILSA
jgi:hypothetical protein